MKIILIVFGVYVILFITLAAYAKAACSDNRNEDSNNFEISICASNLSYCIVGDKYVPCEDIPVFPLTDEDKQYVPYTQEEIAAWRLNSMEPSTGK